eukprot:CAMPEP_0172439970 /NCGR_PEP_ID=MMETSP1065-20121228/794_1 /TAXON_ID=265537 /ORGANISM="Amphiprora paludosa, Strain CCMP125" /LENGTH=202 /DNA_ID=CAMNT_0013188743 /DNA_START=63 /DNA_END=671 /DNA_ORIENTATION=-
MTASTGSDQSQDNHSISTQPLTLANGTTIEVPDKFLCPITLNIMSHPLCNRAGMNFDRHAILNWLEKSNGTCPLTRQPLRPSQLIPNRLLETQIKQFRQEHGLTNQDLFQSTADENDEEEDDISNRRFIGFLPVSERKHTEVLERHQTTTTSLVTLVTTASSSDSTSRRRTGFLSRRSSSPQEEAHATAVALRDILAEAAEL